MMSARASFAMLSVSAALFASCSKGSGTLLDPSSHIAELNQTADSIDWSDAASASIEIAAPLEEVWKYASDSSRAKEWSAYFDHITPLQGPIPDGQPGAVRRCFRNPAEKGPRWDELILQVEPLARRRILSFNFMGFLPAGLTRTNLTFVEQHYESLGAEKTRMTFKTIPVPGRSFLQTTFMKAARAETIRLFYANLENIRAAIEARYGKREYVRLHAWEQPPSTFIERLLTDPNL